MPNINLDDAYILDETGAQVDKVTGLFTKDEGTTSGEKAFAQLNIGTAGSNRNLLDNPWFTVNQRNFTTSTGVNNFYSVDRWYIARGTGTISKTSNGITINGVGASRETTFQQMIDCGDLTGRTVTLSVNDGGTIRQITGTVPARTTSNNIFIWFTLRDGVSAFLYAMATSSAYAYMFQLQVNAGYTLDLRAVKLELGSVSTLANDAPPDYGKELAKCQYYFRRWSSPSGSSAIGLALAVGTTNANFALLSSLRASGSATISFSGLVLSDGTDHAVTNVTVAGAGDGATMRLLLTSTDLTAYRAYTCQISAGGHLDVSKDL